MKKVFSILLAAVLLLGTLTCVPFSVSADRAEGGFSYTVFNDEATVTGCSGGIEDLVVPSTLGGYPVVAIGKGAFRDRSSLKSIEIPASVTSIARDAFWGCSRRLQRISVADDNPAYISMGNCLVEMKTGFLLLGCKNSVIPSDVEEIGDYAFYYCDELTEINLPQGVKTIGQNAFDHCENLKGIEIPDSVTSIGMRAFYSCYGLKTLVIPGSVTVIEMQVFLDCSGLRSVRILDGVTTIKQHAFSGCTGLKCIEIPDSVEIMENDIFLYNNSLTDIYCLSPRWKDGWKDYWNNDTDYFYSNSTATIHWGEAMPEEPEEPEGILGDLTGDGKVGSTDYLLLKRYVLGAFSLTEEQKALADINGDGKINSVDYMLLKRAVLGTYTIA